MVERDGAYTNLHFSIRGRGRGREVTQREFAICDAALALLAEVGYDRMSMDAVAARARASKATIYRRWPGKRELVLEAVRTRVADIVEPPDTGSLSGDIIATLRAFGQPGVDAVTPRFLVAAAIKPRMETNSVPN